MALSYITKLAEAHLKCALSADRYLNRHFAIASCGAGCDHLEGEQLLAIVDDTPVRGVFVGALISDRRYIWRNMAGAGSLCWSDVAAVDIREGILTKRQQFTRFDGSTFRVPAGRTDLSAFFQAVCGAPPSLRCQEPRPLSEPPQTSEQLAAAHSRSCGNEKHRLLYELVYRLFERDGHSAMSRDLCARVSLQHRTEHDGRGSHEGWWLSPLAPADLLSAIGAVFGAGAAMGRSTANDWADFELPLQWCIDTTLPTSSARHRRTLHEAGYASDIARVRVVVRPARTNVQAGSLLMLQGFEGGGPRSTLSHQNPRMLARLFDALPPIEERCLLRRILAGWHRPMVDLLTQRVDQLTAPLPLEVAPARFAAVGLA